MEQTTLESGRVLTHHGPEVCYRDICPLHNPTNHKYRQYPLDWAEDWGVMVRLVDGRRVVDPDEYKLRTLPKNGTLILENAVKCLLCKERIVSVHRHDFNYCGCGNVAVDGGHDYLRRVFSQGGESWADDSVVITESDLRK